MAGRVGVARCREEVASVLAGRSPVSTDDTVPCNSILIDWTACPVHGEVRSSRCRAERHQDHPSRRTSHPGCHGTARIIGDGHYEDVPCGCWCHA